jgi:hypothetical protein
VNFCEEATISNVAFPVGVLKMSDSTSFLAFHAHNEGLLTGMRTSRLEEAKQPLYESDEERNAWMRGFNEGHSLRQIFDTTYAEVRLVPEGSVEA